MMNPIAIILSAVASLAIADPSIRIDGRTIEMDPPPIVQGDDAFVTLDSFAEAIGLEAKIVAEDRLAVLCNDAVCIPVQLGGEKSRTIDGVLRVSLRALAESTGHSLAISADRIELSHSPKPRGTLAVGETLPNVILTDLDGNPVHTADFLGKRILICTWASW